MKQIATIAEYELAHRGKLKDDAKEDVESMSKTIHQLESASDSKARLGNIASSTKRHEILRFIEN